VHAHKSGDAHACLWVGVQVQEKSVLVRMRTDLEKAANKLEAERQAMERKQVRGWHLMVVRMGVPLLTGAHGCTGGYALRAHTHTQTHTLKLKHIHCARTLRRRACTGRWLHPLFCHRPFVLPPLFLPRFVLPQARAYIVCRPGLDTAVLRAAGGGSVCL